MQQDKQEQQEHGYLPEVTESQEQGDGTPSSVISDQGEQKAEEYLDLLRRTQADFVNYRRRMSQEQAGVRVAAQGELLKQLLPVLDDLDRALGAAPPELETHPWVQGLFLVDRRLTTLLEQLGVRQIGAFGEQFDPRKHEALTLESSTEVPPGTILQVVRPGYVLGERIIRPAQVTVAGPPSPTDDPSERQEDSEC